MPCCLTVMVGVQVPPADMPSGSGSNPTVAQPPDDAGAATASAATSAPRTTMTRMYSSFGSLAVDTPLASEKVQTRSADEEVPTGSSSSRGSLKAPLARARRSYRRAELTALRHRHGLDSRR